MEWYHVTTFGQILQTIEASYLQSALKLTYNQKTLQVGSLGSETLYIDEVFTPEFGLVDPFPSTLAPSVRLVTASPDFLPIASESIDVLILPHVLEFETNRHQILREVERVLKPEGRLFILGLNPWSVHGIFHHLTHRSSFWRGNFVSCQRVLDWLSLLKFDAEFSAGFSVSGAKILPKSQTFLTRAQAHLSFAYALKGIKRRYTMIPIQSNWISAPSLAAGHMFENISQ